jgi:hypothetical protein
MKLDCAVVKDLYVLYKEGELSEEVKNALEEHLRECPDCCHVYETDTGFQDILHNAEVKEPSKKTDEKIMLTLKIRRLQIAVFFILAIFLITSTQGYYNKRTHLQSDLSHVEQSLWSMRLTIDNVKSEYYNSSPPGMLLETINDRNNIITRNLSSSEKRAIRNNNGELFIHTRLQALLETLNQRYLAETWSERDEEVLTQLSDYFLKAVELLTEERLTLNDRNSNKLLYIRHRINIAELADIYQNINLLALTYTNYDKLPQEITPLSEEELKTRLTSLFPETTITSIRGLEKVSTWGEVTFDLKKDGTFYYGQLDAFTGDLIAVHTSASTSGELLPLSSAETHLSEFLTRLNGKDFTYQTEYLGINYNFTSNTDIKLYTWRVYPTFQGYRFKNTMFLRFDARTGELYMFDTERGPIRKIEWDPNTTFLIDFVEALPKVQLPEGTPTDLSYKETVIIHSRLTGKFQPAHLYTSGDWQFYINAINGKLDTPR